jgi:AraC family transcriptional regulator
MVMEVRIEVFPEKRIAVVEHFGSPSLEYLTAKRLNQWKDRYMRDSPNVGNSFAIYHTRRYAVEARLHRVDFGIEVDCQIQPNIFGVRTKVIPSARCAIVRDVGGRYQFSAIDFLQETWLKDSGEELSGLPVIYHYLNVGPQLKAAEMITDVYLPLKEVT